MFLSNSSSPPHSAAVLTMLFLHYFSYVLFIVLNQPFVGSAVLLQFVDIPGPLKLCKISNLVSSCLTTSNAKCIFTGLAKIPPRPILSLMIPFLLLWDNIVLRPIQLIGSLHLKQQIMREPLSLAWLTISLPLLWKKKASVLFFGFPFTWPPSGEHLKRIHWQIPRFREIILALLINRKLAVKLENCFLSSLIPFLGFFPAWKYISFRILFQTNGKKSCLYPQFLILLHTHTVLDAGMVQWHI